MGFEVVAFKGRGLLNKGGLLDRFDCIYISILLFSQQIQGQVAFANGTKTTPADKLLRTKA